MRTGKKKNKKLNIVVDANWFVSACISRKSRRTLYHKILKNPEFQVYYSDDLMEEFTDVISRPKFSKMITNKQLKPLSSDF